MSRSVLAAGFIIIAMAAGHGKTALGQQSEIGMLSDPPAAARLVPGQLRPMPIEMPIAKPDTTLPSATLMDLETPRAKAAAASFDASGQPKPRPFPEEQKP